MKKAKQLLLVIVVLVVVGGATAFNAIKLQKTIYLYNPDTGFCDIPYNATTRVIDASGPAFSTTLWSTFITTACSPVALPIYPTN